MKAQEVCHQIAGKIAPQLDELGVESFLLLAYVRDGEGKVSRITLGGGTSKNPAYEDGMRVIAALSERWGEGML